MNKELGISLKGHEYTIETDAAYIKFEKGPFFEERMKNPLKIVDGRTIGQATRDEMHQRLDAWIDGREYVPEEISVLPLKWTL